MSEYKNLSSPTTDEEEPFDEEHFSSELSKGASSLSTSSTGEEGGGGRKLFFLFCLKKNSKTSYVSTFVLGFSFFIVFALIFGILLGTAVQPGGERKYYIAAEETEWQYAEGEATYRKSLFVEYTDETFSKLKVRPPDELHLGLLGPIIRAEVGDTIVIFFQNKLPFAASLHAHGVFVDKRQEGSKSPNKTEENESIVGPGQNYTYTWYVSERSGPASDDPSSIVWPYYSDVNEVRDVNSGLIGPLIITRKGDGNKYHQPQGIDKEFVLMFSTLNEDQSYYEAFNKNHSLKTDQKLSINGKMFNSLRGLKMKLGHHIRWYVISTGNQVDMHVAYWHGNTVDSNGQRSDQVELLPGETRTVDMTPDNAGSWRVQCRVGRHLDKGMTVFYLVE